MWWKRLKTSFKYECELFLSESNEPGSWKTFMKRFHLSETSVPKQMIKQGTLLWRCPNAPHLALHTSTCQTDERPPSFSKGNALTLWCKSPKSCSPRLAGPGQASSSIQQSQQNLKTINYQLQYYINWPITLTDRRFHPTGVAYIHCLSSGFYWKKFML